MNCAFVVLGVLFMFDCSLLKFLLVFLEEKNILHVSEDAVGES